MFIVGLMELLNTYYQTMETQIERLAIYPKQSFLLVNGILKKMINIHS